MCGKKKESLKSFKINESLKSFFDVFKIILVRKIKGIIIKKKYFMLITKQITVKCSRLVVPS